MTADLRNLYAPIGLTPRTVTFILTLVATFLVASIVSDPTATPHRPVHLAAAAAMVVALGSVSGRSSRGATPLSSTLLVPAVVGAAAVVFATWTTIPEVSDYLWSWPLYMAGIIEVVLCLKGRPVPAIVIHAGVAATLALRAWRIDGTPATAAQSLGSYLPMFFVALLIAIYARPVIGEIVALRGAGESASRAETAAVAAVAARNDRLDWIDRTAGPWLRRIASGDPLDDGDRRACRLLEAGIRDALRAPGLTGPGLDETVGRARERGVEVVLLDDGALDGAPPRLRAALLGLVAGRVAAVDAGRVTIRICPPGREEIATVLLSSSGRAERTVLRPDDLEDAARRDAP